MKPRTGRIAHLGLGRRASGAGRRVFTATALLVLANAGLVAQGPPQMPPGAGRGGPPAPLPLAAARKAEFTASMGTWISLDVSPDGKTIVFDLLGDLYKIPIEGGKATRITSGM